MGIAFALVGLVLIITGAQNTYAQLGTQLTKDFTGQGNFTYWIAALLLVGVLGYIPALKTFSSWFMALVLLALFLSKGQGFFAKFSAALASGPVAPNASASNSSVTTGQVSPGSILGPQQNSPLAAPAQAAGAGTINSWLQSLPGIGSLFNPNTPSIFTPTPAY